MDEIAKFNNQTAGRDKLFRLVQYTSRIVGYHLEKRQAQLLLKSSMAPGARAGDPRMDSTPTLGILRAKKLDEILGLMRRLLRFGRFFETLHSALPIISSINNPIVQFTCASSRISNACFLFLDHVVCLHKIGLVKLRNGTSAKLDRLSTRFWLYAICLGLIRDVYEIFKIYREEYKTKIGRSAGTTSLVQSSANTSAAESASTSRTDSQALNDSRSSMEREVEASTLTIRNSQLKYGQILLNSQIVKNLLLVKNLVFEHGDVSVDVFKNFCDLWLPLSSLGYVKLSNGTIGVLGVLSTILSTIPQINPMVKMVPAT